MFCLRCQELVIEPDEEVCPECDEVLGKKPRYSTATCEHCSDRWAMPRTEICRVCFIELNAGIAEC